MYRQRLDPEESAFANEKAAYLRRQVRSALNLWRHDNADLDAGRGPQALLPDFALDRVSDALPMTRGGLVVCGVPEWTCENCSGEILGTINRIRDKFHVE